MGLHDDEINAERDAEIARLRAALKKIIAGDRRTSGTNSEDHMEWDGPFAKIARAALTPA
jgi:hypothetical protein